MIDINSNTHLVACEEIEYFIPTKNINLTEGKLKMVHEKNTHTHTHTYTHIYIYIFDNAITD